MNNRILFSMYVAVLAVALAGCSDSQMEYGPDPNLTIPDATVSRVELVDALWGLGEEPILEAECIAGSTFQIPSDQTFTITKNASLTDEHPEKAIIVSNINISFTDDGADGRGPNCGVGGLHYAVMATEEEPIDIVSSVGISARHSVAHIARIAATDYPSCLITAHFERVGVEDCNATDDSEDTAEQETASDEEEISDEEQSSDPEEDDDSDANIAVVTPIVTPFVTKAQYANDDPVSCGSEVVYSVRMVVDDFDCRLQDTQASTVLSDEQELE